MDESQLPKGEPPGAFDPLHLAARNRDADAVAHLLRDGADPNGRNRKEPNGDGGNTPLWFAAQGAAPDGVPVARILLAAEAEIDARCEYGTTALYIAVSWAHLDMVQFLIASGADLNVRDDDGKTPLEMARAERTRIGQRVERGGASAEYISWLANISPVIDYLENGGG